VPGDGRLALIEVLTALNKLDDYVPAAVEIDGDAYEPRYIPR